ncbi:hypothetical protein Vadar_014794 [Vaccinium darrowii]|uniref:Uncharacterized protein n=1 Tax=Vaccinium darrowii TaxID=229202 RepID=A0ACB7XZ39_9ERIC|nr:hypothetical protein Vadar_014794 [Vaccinium darrowii]
MVKRKRKGKIVESKLGLPDYACDILSKTDAELLPELVWLQQKQKVICSDLSLASCGRIWLTLKASSDTAVSHFLIHDFRKMFCRSFCSDMPGVHPMEGKIEESKATVGYIMVHLRSCSSWTREQDKAFENALAIYCEDSIDRWEKIAAMVPGKTIEEIKQHYLILVEDISAIEAGYVPLPCYKDSASRAADFGIGRKGNQFGNKQSNSGQGVMQSRSDQDRRKGIAWTEEEHRLFLLGLDKYGKGDWRNISRNFVVSRTPTQVASHAQKYFIRLSSVNKERRRSSIHDITSVGGGDSSTLQAPIIGKLDGGASSKNENPAPLSNPVASKYVPPTIVESSNTLVIRPAEIPEDVGSPIELLYDVGVPIPDQAFLLPP